MILIIGGRAAGKRDYARERFGLQATALTPEEALKAPLVDVFQDIIRHLLQEGRDTDSFVEQLIAENPGAVVLCDEVGLGVVPLDRGERIYREAVGRACCRLAAAAEEVHRLVCGLPQRLK